MGIFCMRPKRPQVRCIIYSISMVEKCNFLIGFNPNSILSLASSNNLHAEISISCLEVQFLPAFLLILAPDFGGSFSDFDSIKSVVFTFISIIWKIIFKLYVLGMAGWYYSGITRPGMYKKIG